MECKPYWLPKVLGLSLVLLVQVICALVALASLVVAAQSTGDPLAPVSAVPCDVVSVHDADTLTATAHLPFDIDLRPRAWRAAYYDAWEVTYTRKTVTITPDEIVKGKAALADLQALLAVPGTKFYIQDPGAAGGQTYDRTVAEFWVLTPDNRWLWLAGWMRDRGHLRTPLEPAAGKKK